MLMELKERREIHQKINHLSILITEMDGVSIDIETFFLYLTFLVDFERVFVDENARGNPLDISFTRTQRAQ